MKFSLTETEVTTELQSEHRNRSSFRDSELLCQVGRRPRFLPAWTNRFSRSVTGWPSWRTCWRRRKSIWPIWVTSVTCSKGSGWVWFHILIPNSILIIILNELSNYIISKSTVVKVNIFPISRCLNILSQEMYFTCNKMISNYHQVAINKHINLQIGRSMF